MARTGLPLTCGVGVNPFGLGGAWPGCLAVANGLTLGRCTRRITFEGGPLVGGRAEGAAPFTLEGFILPTWLVMATD